MNLKILSRRRPNASNNLTGIGYVVMNRGPKGTYKSVTHFPRKNYKPKYEYQRIGPPLIHGYRNGFHVFKRAEDARNACELGVNVVVRVLYRNIFNYGYVILGGHIDLRTGKKTEEYKAAVTVTKYRMIIEEVD